MAHQGKKDREVMLEKLTFMIITRITTSKAIDSLHRIAVSANFIQGDWRDLWKPSESACREVSVLLRYDRIRDIPHYIRIFSVV